MAGSKGTGQKTVIDTANMASSYKEDKNQSEIQKNHHDDDTRLLFEQTGMGEESYRKFLHFPAKFVEYKLEQIRKIKPNNMVGYVISTFSNKDIQTELQTWRQNEAKAADIRNKRIKQQKDAETARKAENEQNEAWKKQTDELLDNISAEDIAEFEEYLQKNSKMSWKKYQDKGFASPIIDAEIREFLCGKYEVTTN